MDQQALLVIDVQQGMFDPSNPVYNGEKLIRHLQSLIQKARMKNVPIIYIQHNESVGEPLEYGTEGWHIHSEICPHEHEVIINKKYPDSFFRTNLQEELEKLEVKHLIMAGIQSDVCVDTTCRRAVSLGYKVTLVTDCHSTWNSGELTAQQIINHHNQVLRWFASTKSSSEVEF